MPARTEQSSPAPSPNLNKAALAQAGGISTLLLAFYIFVTYSRFTEFIALRVGNFRLALITCVLLIITTLFNGRLFKTLTHRVIICFLALTVFLVMSIPGSVWPSESFRLVILQWPLPLASCICLVVLVSTLRDCYRIVTAVALGVAFIVVLSLGSSGETLGRLGVDNQTALTLSNPNLLALQLIMGLPFCFFIVLRRGAFSPFGAAALVLSLVTVYVILATGSRSGLLALAFGAFLLFIQASMELKLKFMAAALVTGLVAVMLLPGAILDRYKTLFGDTPTAGLQSEEQLAAAVNSAYARRHHIEQSLVLTLRNPLFGVGAGQFKVAAADLSAEARERAAWLETHNTFTQVSSEVGVPAGIAFILAIWFSVFDLLRVYRATRKRPDLRDVSNLSLMVLLSFGMTIVSANFASIAYQLYFPLLCGTAIAVTHVARQMLETPAPVPNRPAPVNLFTQLPPNPSAAGTLLGSSKQ